jgi:hypothetical protein
MARETYHERCLQAIRLEFFRAVCLTPTTAKRDHVIPTATRTLRIRGEITASIDTPGDGGWRSLQGINLEHLFRIGSLLANKGHYCSPRLLGGDRPARHHPPLSGASPRHHGRRNRRKLHPMVDGWRKTLARHAGAKTLSSLPRGRCLRHRYVTPRWQDQNRQASHNGGNPW